MSRRLPDRGANRPAGALARIGRTEALALVGIVGLAAALRLYQLGSRSIWLDEASSVWAAQLPWPQLIPTLATHDETPPLYYALLHLWIGFGDGEAWIRLPSAAFSLAAVPLAALLGRHLYGPAAGMLAATFVATSPAQVHFAQEARTYSLVVALTLAGSYAALRLLPAARGRSARVWIALFAVSLAGLAAAHNTAALVGVALIAGVACAAAISRSKSAGVHLASATTVAAVLWLPLLPLVLTQSRLVSSHFWIPRPTLGYTAGELLGATLPTPPPARHIQISDPLTLRSAGDALLAAFAVPRLEPLRQGSLLLSRYVRAELPVLLMAVAAGIAVVCARRGPAVALVVAAATILPPVVLIAASQIRPLLIARALIGSGSLALVVLAVACASLPAWLRFGSAALVLWLHLLGLGEYWWYPGTEEWRGAAARLAEMGRPGDLVLVNSRWSQLPLDYYLRRSSSLQVEERGIPSDFNASGKPEPVTSRSDVPRISALIASRDRAWLVLSHTFESDPEGLSRKTLESEFGCFEVWPYPGVSLLLFTRCPAAA